MPSHHVCRGTYPNARIYANEEEYYTIRMGLGLAVALGIWSQCTYDCVCVSVCVWLAFVRVCAWPRGKMMRARFWRVRVFAIVERANSSVEHFILFLFWLFDMEKRLLFSFRQVSKYTKPKFFMCLLCMRIIRMFAVYFRHAVSAISGNNI